MKIRYFIKPRAKDKNKEVKVYVSLRSDSFRKEIATTLEVKPDWWNSKSECTKNNGTVPFRADKEKYLSGLRELIQSRSELIKSGGVDLKKLIREFSSGVEDNDGFWGQWDSFIAYKEKTVSKSRIDKFNSLRVILEVYETVSVPVSWSVPTVEWYEGFVEFCVSEGKSVNTIWSYGNALKTYLNYALKVGWHKSKEFQDIKLVEEITPQFALTIKEIEQLIEYQPKTLRLQKARDAFLVGCYTAARYQDWSKFRLSDVMDHDGIAYIRYVDSKVGNTIFIPIHDKLLEVLKRNPEGVSTISYQKLNDNIKVVAFQAGLTRIVERGKDKAAVHELISTHVARRTAATIMVERGIDYKTIMKLTGHKKLETFLRYVRVDEISHLKKISKAYQW